MFNCSPSLFPPQSLFSVTLTTQSPSPQTSLVFLHVELPLLHTVLENTFIRHYTFSGGSQDSSVLAPALFFFFFSLLLLGNCKNVFLTVVPVLGFSSTDAEMQQISPADPAICQSRCVMSCRPLQLGEVRCLLGSAI